MILERQIWIKLQLPISTTTRRHAWRRDLPSHRDVTTGFGASLVARGDRVLGT